MDDNEFKLQFQKLHLDVEARKEEARQKVRQVIYGTMVVGVAAAAFPFAQKVAESLFQERIENIRQKADFAILQEKNRLEQELAERTHQLATKTQAAVAQRDRRLFLQTLAEEARNERIETRIILSEFYSFLAEDSEKQKWKGFRQYLFNRQKELNEERKQLAKIASDPKAEPQDQNAASARIKQIQRLENPSASHTSVELPEIESYSNSEFIGKEILAALDFFPSLDRLNDYAKKAGVKIYVIGSLRRLADGQVPRSNHFVGHALDFNLKIADTFYNSRKLRRAKLEAQPAAVKKFIQLIRDDPALRWGGDFPTEDPVHVDDGYLMRLRNEATRTLQDKPGTAAVEKLGRRESSLK